MDCGFGIAEFGDLRYSMLYREVPFTAYPLLLTTDY